MSIREGLQTPQNRSKEISSHYNDMITMARAVDDLRNLCRLIITADLCDQKSNLKTRYQAIDICAKNTLKKCDKYDQELLSSISERTDKNGIKQRI